MHFALFLTYCILGLGAGLIASALLAMTPAPSWVCNCGAFVAMCATLLATGVL